LFLVEVTVCYISVVFQCLTAGDNWSCNGCKVPAARKRIVAKRRSTEDRWTADYVVINQYPDC